MRCPHCRGEIPAESQFCGICGQGVASADPSFGQEAASHGSIFALPVSQGARRIRLGIFFLCNLAMLGTGIGLIAAYKDKRAEAEKMVSSVESSVSTEGPSSTEEPSSTRLGNDSKPDPNSKAGQSAEANPTLRTPNSERSSKPTGTESKTEKNDETTSSNSSGSTSSGSNSGNSSSGSNSSGSNSSGNSSSGSNSSGSNSSGSNSSGSNSSGSNSSGSNSSGGNSSGAGASAVDAGAVQGGGEGEPALTPEEEEEEVRKTAARISVEAGRSQNRLSRCYESAAKATTPDNPLQGIVQIRLTVLKDGSTSQVGVHSNNTGSASLGNCLVGMVKGWKFPAVRGESMDFVWPFEFQAASDAF